MEAKVEEQNENRVKGLKAGWELYDANKRIFMKKIKAR
jgi:hypothetical protein